MTRQWKPSRIQSCYAYVRNVVLAVAAVGAVGCASHPGPDGLEARLGAERSGSRGVVVDGRRTYEAHPHAWAVLGDGAGDGVPAGDGTGPDPESEPVYSLGTCSADFGVSTLHEGPMDSAGNSRSTLDRVGVMSVNVLHDLGNAVPYVGWGFNGGRARSFWGSNPNGTPREHPGAYDIAAWLTTPFRGLTYWLSYCAGALEGAAYGDSENPRYFAGVPVSILAEPVHTVDLLFLAFGNYFLLGGRDAMDLVTGGATVPDGQPSTWDGPGESTARVGVRVAAVTATVGGAAYHFANGGGSSTVTTDITQPVINIPHNPGITGGP